MIKETPYRRPPESEPNQLEVYLEYFDTILKFVGEHLNAVRYLDALDALQKADPKGSGWYPSADVQVKLDAYNRLSETQKGQLYSFLPIAEEYWAFAGKQTHYGHETDNQYSARVKRGFVSAFLEKGRSF